MSLSDVCPQSHDALINFPIDTSMHSTQLEGLGNTLQSSTLVYLNSKRASRIDVLGYSELQVIRFAAYPHSYGNGNTQASVNCSRLLSRPHL